VRSEDKSLGRLGQTLAAASRFFEGEIRVEEQPIILIVEDDEELQSLAEDALLSEGGYQPVIAASAEEAVALLQGGQIKYRALVLDISLRGRMNGWEAARKARQIDPNFSIVYMTTGAGDEWPSQGVPDSILLQKPFALAQLVTAVSQLLNKGAAQP
jgi:CheY-like chemotaxis protein